MKSIVNIIIPIYKKEFTHIEQISFEQCFKILHNFEITIIHPEKLDISDLINKYKLSDISFPNIFFKDIKGYNNLLLSPIFYEKFTNYKYILIHQLDCFVFRDDLLFWCNKNYDYIGAPWIVTPKNNLIPKISKLFNTYSCKDPIYYKTGNGGFSLRKVESHLNIVNKYSKLITEFNLNEDVFWSLEAPKLNPNFIIPDYTESVSFAIDRKPKLALKINNNKLPFGCHGINKPKVINFWKKIIGF